MIAVIVIGDQDGGRVDVRGNYFDAAGNQISPQPNESPAHRMSVQLLRHCDMLGQRIPAPDENPLDHMQPIKTVEELQGEQGPVEEPVILMPESKVLH